MHTVILCLVLTGVLWITQSVRVMNLIVNKGIRVTDFLKLSGYFLPSLMFIIMPIATLGATMSSLNKAIHDKEILVLKVCGLSTFQIMKPFLYNALIFVCIAYLFSLYILPKSYQEFKDLQAYLRNNYASVLLEEGVFLDEISDLVLYTEKREGGNSFSNIFAYNTRNPQKAITIIAERGLIDNTAGAPKLIVQNGVHQEHNFETDRITMMTFSQYVIDISFLYEYLDAKRTFEPTERFVHELLLARDEEGVSRNKLISNGHQRIIWPIFCFGFPMLAASTMITRSYHRTASWKKNIPLIAISIILLSFSVMLQNLALQYIHVIWLMYVNALIPFAYSIYLIRQRVNPISTFKV
jgi:lipopolysaccharide export system permease protein